MSRRRSDPAPFKRNSDGLWVARYYDETGKRRQVTATTVEAAVEKRRRRQAGYETDQTFGQFLRWWLDVRLPARVATGEITDTTAVAYRSKVRHHVLDTDQADVTLERLRPQHIEDLLSAMAAKGLSASSIRTMKRILTVALSDAERYELVARNVAKLVRAPSPRKRKLEPLSEAEAERFLTAAKDHPLGALFTVGLALGLRIGEATGLVWPDLDVEQRLLVVQRNLVRVDGQWRFHDMKSHREKRIRLPRIVLAALAHHRELQGMQQMWAGPVWTDSGPDGTPLVFCRSDGTPLGGPAVNEALGELCAAAGLPRMTTRDLRSHCASLLAAWGVPPATAMEILGHSSIQMTIDTYTRVRLESQDAAADEWDRLGG